MTCDARSAVAPRRRRRRGALDAVSAALSRHAVSAAPPRAALLLAAALACAGQAGAQGLYQLGPGGLVLEHTGAACDAEDCPGWRRIDADPALVDLAAGRTGELYKLRRDGGVWRFNGQPCAYGRCRGWRRVGDAP
ncbi:MAG: hypothetical protein AAFR16_02200, partial [Pseudomonadota bacterium]